MMKFLLLLMLTQYAVKCDDTSNYYVIEVPEDEPTTEAPRLQHPYRVYWNVPTMQCKSKKVPFDVSEYGIIQNKDDSFRGEHIAILYDPGQFPALLKNESSGEFKFRNGGVPQEGNMSLHLDTFKSILDQSIPDQDFSGVAIIDFESWRPVFRQNFGVLVPYKDVSYEIEKKLHWWWIDDWIQTEAKQRFEAAARAFMQATLSAAKQLRPRALWGYYGFPYCFNMGDNNKVEQCADNVNKENDDTWWLWAESSALFPSVYSSTQLSAPQLAALIRGRVKEALRVRRRAAPVLPYFWYRYRDGSYLSEVDLSTALKALYNSNASGFIIWGSSNDVNTVDKCQNLLNYVQSTLGPAIAKYTKLNARKDDDFFTTTETAYLDIESDETVNNTLSITSNKVNSSADNTTVVNTRFIPIDPEFPWEPPANYSQEISHYVEEELIKKEGYNETKLDNELTNLNRSLLMEIIINCILDSVVDSDKNFVPENTTMDYETETELSVADFTTQNTANYDNIVTSTSQYIYTEQTYIDNNIGTKNPLDYINSNNKIVSINYLNSYSNEEKEATELIMENQPTTNERDVYTDITTKKYEFNEGATEIELFDITLFDARDVISDNAEGTTENLITLIPNATSIPMDNHNIIHDDQKTVTENDEFFYNSTDTIDRDVDTVTDGTDIITENTAEPSDLMKKYLKESLGFREQFIEYNSTDSPLAERSEPEQVVIYVS